MNVPTSSIAEKIHQRLQETLVDPATRRKLAIERDSKTTHTARIRVPIEGLASWVEVRERGGHSIVIHLKRVVGGGGEKRIVCVTWDADYGSPGFAEAFSVSPFKEASKALRSTYGTRAVVDPALTVPEELWVLMTNAHHADNWLEGKGYAPDRVRTGVSDALLRAHEKGNIPDGPFLKDVQPVAGILDGFSRFEEFPIQTRTVLRPLGVRSEKVKKGEAPRFTDELGRVWGVRSEPAVDPSGAFVGFDVEYLVPVDDSNELLRKGWKSVYLDGRVYEESVVLERALAFLEERMPEAVAGKRLRGKEGEIVPATVRRFLTILSRDMFNYEVGPESCLDSRDPEKEDWAKARTDAVAEAVAGCVRDGELLDISILRKELKEVYFFLSMFSRRVGLKATSGWQISDGVVGYKEKFKQEARRVLPPLIGHLFENAPMPT